MTDISSQEIIDRLSLSIENTKIGSTDQKVDGKESDVKVSMKGEDIKPSIVFGNGCVLNDDQDEYSQQIIKTIFESDRKFEKSKLKEEDKKDVNDSGEKPCLIRMFKGDELDEKFVYTDHDMVSIISRIVNENIDCFEIEEVQTATYDRLRFFNEENNVDAEPGWEEIVHKTPIQELFSMIEFLREHARDSSELDARSDESPSLDMKSLVQEKSSQVTEGEKIDEPFLDTQEKSSGSTEATTADLSPADHSTQTSDDVQVTGNAVEKKCADAGKCGKEKGPETIAPMDDQVKPVLIEDPMPLPTLISDETSCVNGSKKQPAASRPKVTPLDLSIESKTSKSTTHEKSTSALPLPLSSKLDPALLSPLTTAKLRDAIRPLEELYLRNGKDFEKLERLWAAYATDASSKCGLIRACDSPLGQESVGFGDSNPATPVY